MKYRLMAEWRHSVNQDLYWIERKTFWFSPWIFVEGTMSFDRIWVEGVFAAFACGDRKANKNTNERVLREVRV